MKKWSLRGLLAFVFLLVAGYILLPWYSAGQIVAAARIEDSEKLQRYIDFPLLRSNLKAQLQQRLRVTMGDSLPTELDGLFSAGSELFIAPLINQLVSPEGIRELIQGRRDLLQLGFDIQNDTAELEPADKSESRWRLQHWQFLALNRVAADCGEGGEAQVRLILQRQGLHWRLVDIELL